MSARATHDTGVPFIETPGVRPVIVALSGYQGHGKTTAARWLADRHGFVHTSFAAPIRAGLCASFGMAEAWFQGKTKMTVCDQLCGATPREAMEKFGDAGRAIDKDMWVRAWDRGLPDESLIVIDDARYDREVEYALGVARRRGAQFVMMEIARPGYDTGTAHESNRLPAVPEDVLSFAVVNRGTADELGAAIVARLNVWGLL